MILRLEFEDASLSEQLASKGYVTFNCLSQDDIEQLKAMFKELHKESPEGFYASAHLKDAELRKEISDRIGEVLRTRIEKIFKNMNLLGGAFISKAPGNKGILPLHQDWNIVNERKSRSYNLWIPLVDVVEENGAMRVLQSSHEKHQTYRGPNLHPVLHEIAEEVDQYMIPLEMKAGEALVYDHALWHSSPVNQTDELRLAVVFGIVPESAELRFYYADGDAIQEYESNQEFLLSNNPSEGPKGLKLLDTFEFKQEQLSKASFLKIYLDQDATKPSKRSFWSFLRSKSNS